MERKREDPCNILVVLVLVLEKNFVTLSNELSNIPYLHSFYINVCYSYSNLPLWIIISPYTN